MTGRKHCRVPARLLAALLVLACPGLGRAQNPQPPVVLGPVIAPAAGGSSGSTRVLNIAPRTNAPFQVGAFQMPSGEQVIVVSGGVLLTIRNDSGVGLIDIEAEQLVFWTRGDSNNTLQRLQSSDGLQAQEQEFFLAGDVQIRSQTGPQQRNLRADQVYYDVRRNVAVAVNGDLEFRDPKLPETLHLKGDELYQLGPKRFEAENAQVFASRLPSDPGLKVKFNHASIEEVEYERRTLFGMPLAPNQSPVGQRRLVRGEQAVLQVEGVPVFYLPVLQTEAEEPLGPLKSISFRQDQIFGTQVMTSFNVFSLLGVEPIPNTRWTLLLDYLSQRGPATGTTYQYFGDELFGLRGPFAGEVRLYGIYDSGTDILGGGRGEFEDHPLLRGRVLARHQQRLFDDFLFQYQLGLQSDKNYYEQYFKPEFDNELNQNTWLYLKYQRDFYAAAATVQPHLRDWLTETAWLPRADAAALGVSFLDLLTYNVRGSAGYGRLFPTSVPPPSVINPNTDVPNNTGRFNVWQDLSLPLELGAFKVVPYGVLDLTAYTSDLNGESNGRVYGGGGVRGSLPLTRVYPNVQSELFNVNAINHKIVFGGNYYYSESSDPYSLFPQLDRLNDDATDQALRDITPRQPALNPAAGVALATSPIFNPQLYAIRRLVDNRVDTLDSLQVIQADVRQRWQTKRGYPGMQHVVDFFTLDLSGSFFPNPNQDNFGKTVAFLEYDAQWNVGDRTALVSTGYYDPFDDGARQITFGAFLSRPDRTNFFLGFRATDPIDSRALTGAVTYIFSPKYAITAASTYDFGTELALSNALVVTRMGTDLAVSFGFTYNAILNNFGFTLEVVPNIVAVGRARATPTPFGVPLFR